MMKILRITMNYYYVLKVANETRPEKCLLKESTVHTMGPKGLKWLDDKLARK